LHSRAQLWRSTVEVTSALGHAGRTRTNRGGRYVIQSPSRPTADLLHQGHTVLISEQDGQINWPSDKGLYFFDTRVIRSWAVYANGERWELLNGDAIDYYASRIFLTNRSLLTEDGTIPQRTLGLTVSRWISGGMHEDLDVTNNSMKPVRFQLEIVLRFDFHGAFTDHGGLRQWPAQLRRGRHGMAASFMRWQTATDILPPRPTASVKPISRTTPRRWRSG